MRKNELPKNDEIALGISCYIREKAPRRLSAFLNQFTVMGREEIFNFHFSYKNGWRRHTVYYNT
jgi:hypothetical protein